MKTRTNFLAQYMILALLILVIPSATIAAADTGYLATGNDDVSFFLETEQGFISILHHTIKIGETGTVFDYRTMGGQEILFPYERYTVGVELGGRHRVTYIYQPLNIVTNVTFVDPVEIDDTTFDAGTPMEITYGFPFYRLTYTYDLLGNDPDRVLGVGAALQLRNASIRFASLDGTALEVSQNLGPVPALSIYSRYAFDSGLVLTAEATGLYASSAIINGADFEFEGSILDASLRMGYALKNGSELFGNLRFFGGSAMGVSQYPDLYWTESTSDFTANYLSSITLSLGATVR